MVSVVLCLAPYFGGNIDMEIRFLPFLAFVLYGAHMVRFSIRYHLLLDVSVPISILWETSELIGSCNVNNAISMSETKLRLSSKQSIILLSYQGFRRRKRS